MKGRMKLVLDLLVLGTGIGLIVYTVYAGLQPYSG
ncbi:MAG: hypothetical protein UW94_C0013G0001 [Parcubacteria group bacterium GW2011_GWA2_45_14]|nr:MAG: hypothetical protein UW94_C0013G0001 [Parcubacteria group bacterium GW2011_GWA2_45_14]